MDEFRYGIIGTGMMGIEHIHNIDALDGARVVALADPNHSSRDRGAVAAMGNVDCYADHTDLLAAGGCDAVVVASPEAVRTGSDREVSIADGLLSVVMGVAAHRSIEEGRPVDVDELLAR